MSGRRIGRLAQCGVVALAMAACASGETSRAELPPTWAPPSAEGDDEDEYDPDRQWLASSSGGESGEEDCWPCWDDDHGTSGGATDDEADDDSDEDADADDEGGTGEAGSDGAMDEGVGDDAADDAGGGTEGAPDEDDDGGDGGGAGEPGAGEQPGAGMWSHCTAPDECGPGLGCLTDETFGNGFCSITCDPPGDPSGCGATPGEAPAVCVEAPGASICAISCTAGQTCPGGMVCNEGICI